MLDLKNSGRLARFVCVYIQFILIIMLNYSSTLYFHIFFLYFLKTNNFIGLPWCDFCGNFMWGLIAQGVKCEGKFLIIFLVCVCVKLFYSLYYFNKLQIVALVLTRNALKKFPMIVCLI